MPLVDQRVGATNGGVSQFAVDKPTLCKENDWLFLVTNSNVLDGTHGLAPVEPGWELIDTMQGGTQSATVSHMHLFMKKVLLEEAGSSGPLSYVFDFIGGARTCSWFVVCYDGLDLSSPVANVALDNEGGASDSTIFCPTRSTTQPNQMVVRIATIRAFASFTTLPGHQNVIVQTPAGMTFSSNWQTIMQASAGPSASTNIQASVPGCHVGATLILAPPLPVQTEQSTQRPDGVVASIGYVDATSANIANVRGDPDVLGGVGFQAFISTPGDGAPQGLTVGEMRNMVIADIQNYTVGEMR